MEETESVTWQLMTTADIEIIRKGAILSQDGKKLTVKHFSHPDLMLSVVSLDPPTFGTGPEHPKSEAPGTEIARIFIQKSKRTCTSSIVRDVN